MLSLTRKTDYALVALTHLARQAPQRASARQISEEFEVPLPMLMNILKQLLAGGLISSTRGVRGGYCIARAPRDITLAELIEVVEGPLRLTLCCGESAGASEECDLQGCCPTRRPMQKVNGLFRQFLSGVSLADIMTDKVPVMVSVRSGERGPDILAVG